MYGAFMGERASERGGKKWDSGRRRDCGADAKEMHKNGGKQSEEIGAGVTGHVSQ